MEARRKASKTELVNARTAKSLWFGGVAMGLAFAFGALTVWRGAGVTFHDQIWQAIWPRLQLMLVIALVLERAIEVYLYASGRNGPDRFAPATVRDDRVPATPVAATAAIALGLLVALSGVRILEVMVEMSSPDWFTSVVFAGVDILISAGLLAGGAALIHEVMETLRGGLNVGSRAIGLRHKAATDLETTTSVDESEYQILVHRSENDNGRLKFQELGVSVDTTCWWDPDVRIAEGTYTGCSATRMDSKRDSVTGKKRPGIFLPTAVAPDTGENTIFIHEGQGPNWSDGCIVLNRGEMMRMWNAIEKDGQNVSVRVVDV